MAGESVATAPATWPSSVSDLRKYDVAVYSAAENAIRVCDLYADGIEVANAGNTPAQDAYAARYAAARGLYTIAGSDNHRSDENTVLYGVGFEEPLQSAADFVQRVLTRQPRTLLCPADRFDVDPTREPLIPAYWFNGEEEFVPLPMDWLK